MRGALDLSSWQSLVTTLLGLVLVSVVAVGIRLVFMQRVQRRRERENRQINERLKTLIAAYKTLGGSFTGNLEVDPSHRRDLRARAAADEEAAVAGEPPASDRRRRVRDAVEAALSDVILLGTEAQVRLAVEAAREMVAGRPVTTAPLVASLRAFIRDALDLDAVPTDLAIPDQGPSRGAGGSGGSGRGGRPDRGAAAGAGGGRGGGGGGGAAGAGLAGGSAGGLAAGGSLTALDTPADGDEARPSGPDHDLR